MAGVNICMYANPRDYSPDQHNFEFIADIQWPGTHGQQLDWITGVTSIEHWLLNYTGPKYQRWAWHWAQECYHVGVAFKYDKHRTLFLLTWT
jgi:hypothetical protein